MKTTRRNLLTGATALAAGAILPAGAAMAQNTDMALLVLVSRARALLDGYAKAEAEAHRTYQLVIADPDWPDGSPAIFADDEIARGSTAPRRALYRLHHRRMETIYRRHGYRAAHDAWGAATRQTVVAVERLSAMRAGTIEGAMAKARLLRDAAKFEDIIDPEDIPRLVIDAIVVDMARLAKGGAA